MTRRVGWPKLKQEHPHVRNQRRLRVPEEERDGGLSSSGHSCERSKRLSGMNREKSPLPEKKSE